MKTTRLLDLVAAAIKARRKALGMTIAELAEAADIDTGFLAHVETAARAPSLAVLDRLLAALNMAPPDLLAKTRPRGSGDGDELTRRTRALLRKLDRRHQDDVLAIVSRLRRPEEIRALRVLLRS